LIQGDRGVTLGTLSHRRARRQEIPMPLHTPEIFRWPWAVVFWLAFFLVFVRESRVVRNAFPDAASAQDAGSFRILMVGSMFAMLLAIAAAWLPWAAMPWPVAAVVVGTATIIAGGVLRRACFRALGQYFTGTVVVKADQPVIQNGPYRLVRHPSYTAAMLMYTGIGIALGNWISLAVLFLAHCVLYGIRVAVEERALLATIGQPYRDYMARTTRFIPHVI
jgi:protein-S-isoprenylcysteine O-methyltransferase Ste14